MDTTRPSLLLRIRDRADGAAWAEFDAIYRPMLLQYARSRGLDAAVSEDVVQDCMTSIHQNIDRFEYDPRKGRFKGWLRTLVNNRFRNILRDRKDQPAESQDFKRPQQREAEPDELFDRIWQQEHLKHCLKTIRDEVEESTFRAFVAYVIEDQPIDKVCADLGMNPNQVHAIKFRITRRLQQRMRELIGADEL